MDKRKIISLILKITVTLSALVGVLISTIPSPSSLLYFTTQSNIWIGAACLVGIVLMIRKAEIKKWMYTVKLIFTVSITLTGVVYCVLLAPLFGSSAYGLSSLLTHVIVPAASVLDFAVYDYPAPFRKRECLLATIPPFYYLGFAAIGYVLNWQFSTGENYPYFFLNWGSPAGAFGFSEEPPYIGVFYYVLIMVAFVVGVGALYILIARLLRKITVKSSTR